MSRWWWRSVSRDEECDVSSASSIDGSSDRSVGGPESATNSFVILRTPLWAPRRCVSAPSKLNYVFKLVSGSNGIMPADYLVWRESERDCGPGRTISKVLASSISLLSSTQHDYQEGSGHILPDQSSEISSASLSECDSYEEPLKRETPMHDKPSSKKTLLLPELIDAAVESTAPVSICDVVCSLSDPTITVRVSPQKRVSCLHWYAFFCDFWPVVMNRFGSDFSAVPACLLEQYQRFFTLPSGAYRGAHITMYKLLTPHLSEITALDPQNKCVYDSLCCAYRAAYAKYLLD